MKKYFLFIYLISFVLGDEYTIVSGGFNRTFNSYFPSDTTEQKPMVIIMHGLGGTNTDMEGLIDYFTELGVVPVFPQAYYYINLEIVGSTTMWNHGAWPELLDDVTFISDVIDYMVTEYSFIDPERIYATGMSNGGFMSYRLACDLSNKITAVASVTGNFYLIDDGLDCVDQNREIPIMHIHGTVDNVVAYDIGGWTVFGQDIYGDENLTITESIDFWTDYNNLTIETVDTLMADGGYWWYGTWIPTNSIKFTYSSENTTTQFVHIRAEGGGHIWFDDAWGWGFDSHEEVYNFFMQYQLSDFVSPNSPENFTIYPLDTYVVLVWDLISDDDIQYYLLERSTDPAFLNDVVSTEVYTNQFEDYDLEYDTEYFYRVAYFNGDELSQYSEVLSTTLEWMVAENRHPLPNSFTLHQNYPNPFNPVTTLRYELPIDELVNITVYDMLGNVINQLVDEVQNSGCKSIQWDATNNQGQPVSAGVYLYSIEAGEFRSTKKMVLLK